jgi:light-regulated signal transduction histidine kinase (bacteriophytochrome)
MTHDESTGNVEAHRRTLRHDMRTPVNHILSYAELVREEAQDHGLAGLVVEMEAIEGAGKAAFRLLTSYMETLPELVATGPDAAQRELAELMREVKQRVARIRASHAVQDVGQIDDDLERIGAAAQRILVFVAP